MDVDAIIAGLSEAQKRALFNAIDCLDGLAGEGVFVEGRPEADVVLLDLCDAFIPDWTGNESYPALAARLLEEKR